MLQRNSRTDRQQEKLYERHVLVLPSFFFLSVGKIGLDCFVQHTVPEKLSNPEMYNNSKYNDIHNIAVYNKHRQH